jgi:D-beta-D-heptose 7-phosphate kinase/D-beta-D-heptose 1-phosphate adenosyltransferase
MCRNQQLCRLDREAGRDAYRLPSDVAEAFLAERVRQADAVIVSDYAKGVVTGDLVRRVQELAGPDKLVAVDPKPRADLTFEGVGLMTPNRAEALQLAHCTDADTTGFPAETVCSRIYAAYRPALLVITLGADGMLISTQGRPDRQVSTAAREVFDVSGAGDTVIAVLTAALAAHATPDEAVHLANLAAGVVVGKIGTATATAAEILAYASRT